MIQNKVSICAMITVRNEYHYLKVLLPHLAEQGIDVIIIDNDSTDNSHELYSKFTGEPVIMVETLPFRGSFSLSEQLASKQDISERINHDWIIHHDADEIMEHYKPGLTLRDAIEEADETGYNALNFDEFVFLPEPDADYSNGNYYAELLRYYFFQPGINRLNRAWKRTSKLHIAAGGHELQGGKLSVAPTNLILRHYMVLSESHAQKKYLNRSFDDLDLQREWHGNRLNFTETNLMLPGESDYLFTLKRYDSKEFSRTKPATSHYWEW